MGLKKLKNRTILSISSYCEANVMHVNGSTKAKTALFWVLFRVIAKIWKKVQFGEATLLTQRLKPTFFSDFRALCMCGTRCHDSQWARKLKKSRAKKLVKSNKSISQKNFLTKFHFLQFQKWPKMNFWPFLKLQKRNLVKKNFMKLMYLISRVFLTRIFF